MRQFDASTGYDVMDRLGEIHIPTLILHGRNDKIAPYQVAVETQAGIADAHLVTFPGSHIFFIVRPKACLEAVNAFLDHGS
jgi:pimeloyl-ACP methyl ester carboxylesterase